MVNDNFGGDTMPVLVVSATLLGLCCHEILVQRDLQLMQGEWEAILVEGAARIERPYLYSLRLTISGSIFRFHDIGDNPTAPRPKEMRLLVRLYPTMSPKGIDFLDPMPRGPNVDPGPEVVEVGIYEVTQHILIIKAGATERPSDFSVPLNLKDPIVVFRRLK
jgi:hypothetical protein